LSPIQSGLDTLVLNMTLLGIAAGTRFGVAKQARIIDVKVITDTGRGFASDMWVSNQLISVLGHGGFG
jgi:hypothetical protein